MHLVCLGLIVNWLNNPMVHDVLGNGPQQPGDLPSGRLAQEQAGLVDFLCLGLKYVLTSWNS